MSSRYVLLALIAGVFAVDQAEGQLFSRMRSNYQAGPQQTYNHRGYSGYGSNYGYSPDQRRYCPYDQANMNARGAQSNYRPSTYQPYGSQRVGAVAKPGSRMQAVTVYDPRTGLRSVRMVAVPQTALSQQQPYGHGQAKARGTVANPATSPAATPELASRSTKSSGAEAASVLRTDSAVQPATFEDQADSGGMASTIESFDSADEGFAVEGEFSVLDLGDKQGSEPGSIPVEALELSAPEN